MRSTVAPLYGAGLAVQMARGQTEKLKELNEEAMAIRQSIRALNRSSTAVMEAQIRKGQEIFSDYLIEISDCFRLDIKYRPLVALYVNLLYGDPE
jgi:hypothetical protein